MLTVAARPGSPRARAVLFIAHALALIVIAAAIVDAPALGAAEPDQVGWWNRANTGASGPLGTAPPPPTPDVPESALPVSLVLGEPDRISALGLPVDTAAPGAEVRTARLVLEEAGDDGANRGAEEAVVVACPITEFWTGGANQPFDAVPKHDCELGRARGERSAAGTWTFDLSRIAAQWIDPGSGLVPNGIVLRPAGPDVEGEPPTFQVAYAAAPGDITFTLQTRGGDDAIDDPFASPTTVAPDPEPTPPVTEPVADPDPGPAPADPAPIDPAPAADVPAVDDVGSVPIDPAPASSFEAPSLGSGDLGSPVLEEPDVDPGEQAAPSPAAPDAGAPSGPAPATVAEPAPISEIGPKSLLDIPGPIWLLAPLLLAVLGITSYSLGPAGEPVLESRSGSITRALAARRAVPATTPQEPR